MVHERRWRRAFRWSAAIAGVCMAGFFLSPFEPMWVSQPRMIQTSPPVSWMMGLRRGMLQASGNFAAERRGWRALGAWDHHKLDYFPRRAPLITLERMKTPAGTPGAWYFCLDLPLVYPAFAFGVTALATGARWARLAHRRRKGWCLRCRYDRAGLSPQAACPECGWTPVSDSLAPAVK
ncbi:MAG TPA: hypothetical protein VD997_14720 [Phycisphaerales bacterium]|nr:hypothetical protein [Phycisphaerales bacterium]